MTSRHIGASDRRILERVTPLHFCPVSDGDFPSGPWTGFYTYQMLAGKYRTDLILGFADGVMTGEGNDYVGPFVISGRYDASSKECYWTKTYVGSHDVAYTGFREGKGIWGTWEVVEVHRGGFHIWPVGEGMEGEAAEAEEEAPVELVKIG